MSDTLLRAESENCERPNALGQKPSSDGARRCGADMRSRLNPMGWGVTRETRRRK